MGSFPSSVEVEVSQAEDQDDDDDLEFPLSNREDLLKRCDSQFQPFSQPPDRVFNSSTSNRDSRETLGKQNVMISLC